MQIINREVILEPVRFDKITERITKLSNGLDIIPEKIAQKVCSRLSDKNA